MGERRSRKSTGFVFVVTANSPSKRVRRIVPRDLVRSAAEEESFRNWRERCGHERTDDEESLGSGDSDFAGLRPYDSRGGSFDLFDMVAAVSAEGAH